MKKIVNIVGLVLVLLVFTGCYKDKGNYSYKVLPQPLISGIDALYVVFIGEKLQIKPVIQYAENTSEIKNIEYSWILDTKEISKERDLNVMINFPPGAEKYASFTIKDLDNNVSTIVKFKVKSESEFKEGWLVLTEMNGKGHLCFQRMDDVFYENIYEKFNGESLSSQPVRLKEHWLTWMADIGQINVLCKGGPDYSVELDGSSFQKVISNKQEFVGENAPANFAPVNSWSVPGFDYLINDDGKMYSREITAKYPDYKYQDGRFADIPIYGDYELSDWSMRGDPYMSNDIISFDRKNKRYVQIVNCEIKSFDTSKDINKAFAVENMTKDVIAGGYSTAEGMNSDVFVTILKDFVNGKYYMHKFLLKGWNAPKVFYSTSETLIKDKGLINEETKFAIFYRSPYVIFSSGSCLYRYHTESDLEPELIKDYGKKIQAIGLAIDSKTAGLVIGNGDTGNDFITADISLIGAGKVLTQQKGVCGKGVDVLFKMGVSHAMQD